MICFLTKYLLLPQRMDGWSPTYRAERVKVIGRLINLTPNQNQGWIAGQFRKKLTEEVTCPLSEAVDARGAEKRAIFITDYLYVSNQASNPTHHRSPTYQAIRIPIAIMVPTSLTKGPQDQTVAIVSRWLKLWIDCSARYSSGQGRLASASLQKRQTLQQQGHKKQFRTLRREKQLFLRFLDW